MGSHDMERVLREGWREYVAEVVRWVPAPWRDAVAWLGRTPDLPFLAAMLTGETPRWALQDQELASAATKASRSQAATSGASTAPPTQRAPDWGVVRWWAAHWRSLWPRHSARDDVLLNRLAGVVADHVERLDRATPGESSNSYRLQLARTATKMLRGHAGSPVAVFCHFILTALDLQRLRGGLTRRRLFDAGANREAA